MNNNENILNLKHIAHHLGNEWKVDCRDEYCHYLINGKYKICATLSKQKYNFFWYLS